MNSPQPTSQPIPPASDARRAARNAGALIAASVLSKGALFLWQLVLAPWLGTTGYGIYTTVASLLVIGASVASFSMSLILIRDVARDPDKSGAYWSAALVTQTLLGLLAYLGINGAAWIAGYSETIRAYTALAGISLFVDLFGNIGFDLLIARERMVWTSTVDVAHIVLRVALAGLALAAGWGLTGIYLATIGTGLLRSLALIGLNLRTGIRPRWPLDRSLALPLLLNSAPLALTGFLSLAYQHADKLMTTGIIGETSTGYLGPAFIINFGVIEILSTTVLVAVYPMMARYYGNGRDGTFGFMVEKLSLFMLAASLPIAITISIFAEPITLLLFSEQFAPTAGVLAILIWYTALTMVGNVFAKALLIQNRQRLLLIIRSASLLLNVALNAVLLVTYRDPRGAAIASVLAEILFLLAIVWAFRAEGWSLRRRTGATLRLIALAGLVAALMIALGGINVLLGGFVGLAVYTLGLLWGPILGEDDWDLMYRLAMAMPGGAMLGRWWQRDISVNW